MDADWTCLLPPPIEWRTVPEGSPLPLAPAARGPRGQPLWAGGRVGSITHAGGRLTVATAPRERVAALGIDMEALRPLPPGLWPTLLDATELAELAALPPPQRGLAALARWCLKEAAFKALQGSLPLEQITVSRDRAGWRPGPRLAAALRALGYAPRHLTMRAAAARGWQCAALSISAQA